MNSIKNYLFVFASTLILAAGFAPAAKAGTIYGPEGDWTSWQAVESLPSAVRGQGVGVWSNHLYSIGGFAGFGQVSNVYCFDGTNWTMALSLPVVLEHLCAGVLSNGLFAVGGRNSGSTKTNVYQFDGIQWTEVASLPLPVYSMARGVVSNVLYVAGGFGGSEVAVLSNVFRFDGNSWSQVLGLPVKRCEAGGAVLNGAFYVAGGYDEGFTSRTNMYRFDGSAWQQVPGLPGPAAACFGMGMVTLGDAIYSVGGNGPVTNVYRFDGNNWTQIVGLPEGRRRMGLEVFNGKIYCLGGDNPSLDATSNVYFLAATLPGVSPSSGSAAGGYVVTINGMNLCNGSPGDVTNVTLCGVAAAVVSESVTQVVVNAGAIPPGELRSGDVAVHSVFAGLSVGSNTFTYTAYGPLAGGNTLLITNGHYGTITNVLVGGMAATIHASGTTWARITVPAGAAPGAVDVVIQTSDNGEITLVDDYMYTACAKDLPLGAVVYDDNWTWSGKVLGWRVVHTNYGGLADTVTLQVTNSVTARRFAAGWHNDWGTVELRNWLNADFQAAFSPAFSGIVCQTVVPWARNNALNELESGVSTDRVFIASRTELGGTAWAGDGTVLDWFSDPGTVVARRGSLASGWFWTRTGERAQWSGTWYNLSAYAVNAPVGDAFIGGQWIDTLFHVLPVLNISGNSEFLEQPDGRYKLVGPSDQTITFPNPGNQLTTNRVELTATASSGLDVSYEVLNGPANLVDGSALVFTNAGEVVVTASQPGNGYWPPAKTETNIFNVTKVEAAVYLQNLLQVYNGTARHVTATTDPAGLTVEFTYDGSWAPTNAGNYAVTGTLVEAMYQGVTTGQLTVGKADQAITNFPNPGDQLTTNTVGLSAQASSGLPVSFTNLAGNPVAWQNATTLTFNAAGQVSIIALQAGNTNWNAAPSVTNTFNVLPAPVLAGWLSVQVTPSGGNWQLTAPPGYTGPTSGTGSLAAVSAVTGEYGVSYGELSGYVAPSNQAGFVTAGSTTLFAGIYLQNSTNIGTPSGVAATEGTYTNKIRVVWNGVEGATGYDLLRSRTNNASSAVLIAHVPADAAMQTPDAGLPAVLRPALQAGRRTSDTRRQTTDDGRQTIDKNSGRSTLSAPRSTFFYDDYAINPILSYYYWVRAISDEEIGPLSYAGTGYAALSPEESTGTADIGVSDFVFLPVNILVSNSPGTISCRVMNYGPDALCTAAIGFDFHMTSTVAGGADPGSAVAGGADPAPSGVNPGLVPLQAGSAINARGYRKADASATAWIGSARSNLALTAGQEALVILQAADKQGVVVRGDLSGIQTAKVTVRHLSSLYDPTPANNTATAAGTVRVKTGGVNSIGRGVNDYDGDGKSDPCLYQSALGRWYVELSGICYSYYTRIGDLGAGLDPAPGDYDGDGITDLAVYDLASGLWTIQWSSTGEIIVGGLGGPEFVSAPSDWDGDRLSDPAVYREADGLWIGAASSHGYALGYASLGGAGCQPVIADYDGDGKADLAVYEPATGLWIIGLSGNGYQVMSGYFGSPAYLPAPADYDGDGLADPAVFEAASGKWQVLMSGSEYALIQVVLQPSAYSLQPVPADYDGDGKADLAVYSPGTGLWQLFLSSQGYQELSGYFGGAEYVPVSE